jgi:hypothetical protein
MSVEVWIQWVSIQGASDGKLKMMVARIWFDANGAVLKRWISRGAIEEVTSEGTRESSRRIPEARLNGGGKGEQRREWFAKTQVAAQRAGGRRAGKALNPAWIGQSSADSGTKPALLPTSDHPSI